MAVSSKLRMLVLSLLLVASFIPDSEAGLVAYGICQAGCAKVVVPCYSGAGLVFGTVTAGVGAPAAAIACNAGFGACYASCAALLLAPTP